MKSPQSLYPILTDMILQHLSADCPWRDSLLVLNETDSTNNDLKKLAADGAPHGTVVVAIKQTAGRGRMGRQFLSPEGGIYMSLLLRPNCQAAELLHLTCAVAVGVCDAIEKSCGFRPKVKWINDLILENKKLGGILTELSLNADGSVNYAIVGIGINVGTVPEAVADMAAALSADRDAITAALIDTLSRMDFMDESGLMGRYRVDCMTLGQQVRVLQTGCTGTAENLTDDGSLIIRKDDGTTVTVGSGEVSVRGMYGYL